MVVCNKRQNQRNRGENMPLGSVGNCPIQLSGVFFDLVRTNKELDIRHVKCASGPTRGSSRKHF